MDAAATTPTTAPAAMPATFVLPPLEGALDGVGADEAAPDGAVVTTIVVLPPPPPPLMTVVSLCGLGF